MGDCTIDHGRVALDGTRDRHLFDAAGELRKQSGFSRQRANMNGMNASLVHNNRDFNARTLWKIGDEVGITDIAIELEHLTAFEGIDDVGGIFMPALEIFVG